MSGPRKQVRDEALGSRLKELRDAFGKTQEGLADASGGRLTKRDKISRLENGHLLGKSGNVRAGYAQACGVSLDVMTAFFEGKISVADVVAAAKKRESSDESSALLLRRHPQWAEILSEAKRLKPKIAPDVFEQIGDRPFVWGPLDAVDGPLLAELASSLENWDARRIHAPASSRREP